MTGPERARRRTRFDPIERVFGRIAVARHHYRHRLARATDPIDRERVMPHRLLHPGDERPGPRGDVLAGQDGDDLGHRERGGRVKGDDQGAPAVPKACPTTCLRQSGSSRKYTPSCFHASAERPLSPISVGAVTDST